MLNQKALTISVASGKGGTGKTLVSTSLALAVAEKLQFLDCDVEEPNAHVFLQPELRRTEPVLLPFPVIDAAKCTACSDCAAFCQYNALAVVNNNALVFNELCHSCGGCKLVCPEDAIDEEMRAIGVVEIGERQSKGQADTFGMPVIHGLLSVGEALAPPIIKAVKDFSQPDMLTIIDSAPGTACPMIETVKGTDYCILVTEPTPFGLHDLKLAVGVTRELNVPCGAIINRADAGDRKVFDYCQEENIPILMEIPLKREIAIAYSDGIPLVAAMPEWKDKFRRLFEEITTS
jgi:MinD superfamily P-loop ATPase